MWTTRAAWIAIALTVVVLARGLPAETFFVGDPGVKLVAARAALDHPARPLDIPLPFIGGERVAFVEPFFHVHGDHAHAVTSELFPVLSAPFIEAFGIRGAFVLPALGFLLTIWSCARLASALDGRPMSPGVLLGATLGTPLLFYGLEFWEHAPAVGIATLATTILIVKNTTTDDSGVRDLRGRALVAGLLYGVAILLRPEAAWFFLAVAVSSRLRPSPLRLSTVAFATAGIALALTPLAVYSVVHFGTLAPPHLGTQADLMTQGWMATRAHVVSAWFLPSALQLTPLWGCALLAMTMLGLVMPGAAKRTSVFLAAVVAVDIVLVVLTAPNDGGGQWGPRYLLFAFVPASLLAVDALQALSRRRTAGTVAMVLIVGTAAWIQRTGYRELRSTKIIYGRVLDLVRQQVPSGRYAVTDLWWLDQVAASATRDRTILFLPNADARRDATRRLHDSGEPTLTAFVGRGESADVDAWSHLPCYETTARTEIETRSLVAITLQRRPDCDPPSP